MILSNTCKYGIRSVIYLAINAKDGNKIGIKKISKDLDIPTPFLGKILQMLAKRKILTSTKGPNGGFGIGKPPEKITLLDIVEIIDGRDVFDACVISLESCSSLEHKNSSCPIHKKFSEIRSNLINLFENETIDNMACEIEDNKLIEI
jgi:Rrf2 family protein